jgi:hypothetical protein
MDGSVTLDALAKEFSAAFGAGRAQVQDDLLAFARRLQAQELLEPAPAPPH